MLTTFGDGATSEGEWHESVNFAAVHRLPIVFLCENNEWAISTPLARQMAQPDVYKRAAGYGLPGAVVNGMDPIACYAVVGEALGRARSGGGPPWSKPSATDFYRTPPTTTTGPIVRGTKLRPAGRTTRFRASSACWWSVRSSLPRARKR